MMNRSPSEVSVAGSTKPLSVTSSRLRQHAAQVPTSAGVAGAAAGAAAPRTETASNAPTSTTAALNGRLLKLTVELDRERSARIHAQEQLKRTCAELEALETVLHLRPAVAKIRTYNNTTNK